MIHTKLIKTISKILVLLTFIPELIGWNLALVIRRLLFGSERIRGLPSGRSGSTLRSRRWRRSQRKSVLTHSDMVYTK